MLGAGRVPADHAARVVAGTRHGVVVGIRTVPAGTVATGIQDGETGRSCRVDFLPVSKIVVLTPHFKLKSALLVLPAGPVELRYTVRHGLTEHDDSPLLKFRSNMTTAPALKAGALGHGLNGLLVCLI